MSTAIHELLNNDKTAASHGIQGIQGGFPVDEAVIEAMPTGTKVVSAEPYGYSAWTITARISVILPDGRPKKYFLKVGSRSDSSSMSSTARVSSSAQIIGVILRIDPIDFHLHTLNESLEI